MKSAQLVQLQRNQMPINCKQKLVKESEAVDGELDASLTPAELMFPPVPPSEEKLKTKEPSMKAAAHITTGVKEFLLLDPP